MTAGLLDGWFCDRGTGRGKPVYSTGTVIVPTNGIVAAGIVSAGTPPTFANAAPAIGPTTDLLTGWFCDRVTGQGKPVLGDAGIVPTNGPIMGIEHPPRAPDVGGKFYFELTVGDVSPTGGNLGSSGAPQFGFINAHQRDTIPSELLILQGLFNGAQISGPPNGGRTISMGASVDSAIISYYADEATICGNSAVTITHYGWTTGDIVGVAVDTINSLMWARNWTQTVGQNMTTGWNGGASPFGPSLGTGGYDISPITGALIIWFGASGLFKDSVTLNAGFGPSPSGGVWSQFHGIDGTGVIPAGFTAWDQTGDTAWDASAATGTSITGFSQPFGSGARLEPILSNGSLKATIETHDAYFFGSANPYVSTWQTGFDYLAGSVVMGASAGSTIPSSFYWNRLAFTGGTSTFDPSLFSGRIQGWAAATIGVVSNTSKARV